MNYSILKILVDIFIMPFLNFEVIGKPEFPDDSGALVASNHINAIDPILVSYAIYPDWLHHIAKKEIFKIFFLVPVLNWVGAIPLNRSRPGTGMVKQCRKLFAEKKYVSIFPQGTRMKEGFGTIKKGAARLALIGQVPIYPVAVTGLENIRVLNLLKRPKVRIIFGEPIDTSEREYNKEEIVSLKNELEKKMKRLYYKNRI